MSILNSNVKKTLISNIMLLIIGIGYSLIRYYINSFRITNPDAVFFINKGLSFLAAVSISLSYITGNLIKLKFHFAEIHLGKSKYFGIFGFFIASSHMFLSLMLLSKDRFPYLYLQNENFNFFGEMTILFGVVAFALFMMPAITSISSVRKAMTIQSWKNYQQIGYIGSLFLLFHILFVDFINISHPESWRYYLLPLSIIAWMFIITSLGLKIFVLIKEFTGWLKLKGKSQG